MHHGPITISGHRLWHTIVTGFAGTENEGGFVPEMGTAHLAQVAIANDGQLYDVI